jgi:hypothetical protein
MIRSYISSFLLKLAKRITLWGFSADFIDQALSEEKYYRRVVVKRTRKE